MRYDREKYYQELASLKKKYSEARDSYQSNNSIYTKGYIEGFSARTDLPLATTKKYLEHGIQDSKNAIKCFLEKGDFRAVIRESKNVIFNEGYLAGAARWVEGYRDN